MAESLNIDINVSKHKRYEQLLPQLKALLEVEGDLIANMANVCAVLKSTFDFFWVGFYIVKNEQLVLGPFQGTLACTRIGFNKGVCGTSWANKQIIIVPNVDEFPGHIACSSLSKSEIVIPAMVNDEVQFVLDVDSDKLNDFNNTDAQYLQQVVNLLVSK